MSARQPGNSRGESFQGLLLRLRGRTGLSQPEVASRLGMHPRSVQGWESALTIPRRLAFRD
jgi:DNA-binding transcriptional regulator YiaG